MIIWNANQQVWLPKLIHRTDMFFNCPSDFNIFTDDVKLI